MQPRYRPGPSVFDEKEKCIFKSCLKLYNFGFSVPAKINPNTYIPLSLGDSHEGPTREAVFRPLVAGVVKIHFIGQLAWT